MTLLQTSRRIAHGLTLAAITALLAACGGSESVNFVPARVLSFGDESSVITADGKKYTINGIVPNSGIPGTVECVFNPIWNQVLATSYGLSFAQCPGSVQGSTPTSLILAREGATATGTRDIDFPQQITRQLAAAPAGGGGINSNDLVTVLIGVNDVVSIYERYKSGEITSPEATSLAEQTGEAIASQLNRITAAGGKIIIETVPDVGVTPYALAEDANGRALLETLTSRLNARLLVTMDNDGRKIGLIEINPYLFAIIGNPVGYGYANVTDGACLAAYPLPNCTSATLKTNPDGSDATPTTWLWASALQPSAGAHQQMGNLASSRAHNQPFSN
ncbi:MAG TPA: SGNH/GDSL hydrolase family protein [Burkholderiaceae bacterium]|jgi:phospholipase/lecithinase/hemolysin|nr:SGNH/GDSL hydrolase family protein [Burkholderiaceae bacterium]